MFSNIWESHREVGFQRNAQMFSNIWGSHREEGFLIYKEMSKCLVIFEKSQRGRFPKIQGNAHMFSNILGSHREESFPVYKKYADI
jgi:hypothetical protein